jgi:hypothetical protein
VDDSGGRIGRDGDKLKQVPGPIRADDQQALLPAVVVLNQPNGVVPSVGDVVVVDPMPASAPTDFHTVKYTLTASICKGEFTPGERGST